VRIGAQHAARAGLRAGIRHRTARLDRRPAGASDFLLPKVDLSRLFPEPASEFLSRHGGALRCNAPVRDLAALLAEFRAVIVAVGPHQLKALLPALAPEYEYQPIYTCYLQYAENAALGLPDARLPEGLMQWAFDRAALTGERGLIALRDPARRAITSN
jgi:hypothetical protein